MIASAAKYQLLPCNKIEGTPILRLAIAKRLQVKKSVKKFRQQIQIFVKQFVK